MSVTVLLSRNPLKPNEREVEKIAPQFLGDWLMRRFPAGAPGAMRVIVNGKPVELTDCEHLFVSDGDHVLLLLSPGWELVVKYAVEALIAIIVSTVVSALFRPRKPSAITNHP